LPHFNADLGQLARIRDFVTDSAVALGVTEKFLDDLRLAVDEAVTNIIVHGYKGAGSINIEVVSCSGDLVIRLQDKAPPFDPAGARRETLARPESRTQPGGFGLYLMHNAMDEITYRRVNSSNELTLTKRDVIDIT
jgi:anti-sigma regulatory factor (Ser/Thr protein kinase)